jgi:hypothetical protein
LAEQRKDGVRVINEVVLYEGSAVLWGANPQTPTMEVAKTIGIYNEDDELPKRIEKMIKRLKSDSFNEDEKQLFMIELKQMQQMLIDAEEKATPTVEQATDTAKGIDWHRIALKLLEK